MGDGAGCGLHVCFRRVKMRGVQRLAVLTRRPAHVTNRRFSDGKRVTEACEVVGEKLGRSMKVVMEKAEEYKIPAKAGDTKRKVYEQVGVDEPTGDKVLAGAAAVGVGVKTIFMFKKTVVMAAAAAAATVVGKVKAPEVTDQVVGAGKKVLGGATKAGSALYRGVRKGLDEPDGAAHGKLDATEGQGAGNQEQKSKPWLG